MWYAKVVLACLTYLSFVVCSYGKSEQNTRTLSTEFLFPPLNLTYGDNETAPGLVHTTASGQHDDLHYVYSTLGFPSVLIVKTEKKSEFSVDWDRYLSRDVNKQEMSLSFSSNLSSALLSFDTLYVFNDTKDLATMDDTVLTKVISTGNLTWKVGNQSEANPNLVRFVSEETDEANKTQVISIEFSASSGSNFSTLELPHMLLNENITEINVYLEDVYCQNFSAPRLGVGMTLVTSKSTFEKSKIEIEKTLDDEFSPGGFRTYNWLSNEIPSTSAAPQDNVGGAFVQWKPIGYTYEVKSIYNFTRVAAYGPKQQNDTRYTTLSLATGFYGHRFLDDKANVDRANVSFGLTEDGFYSSSNFLTWQLTFGLGPHPQAEISLLIILLIAIGLGIPLLIMIGGAIYLPIRSRMARRRGYEELSDSYPRIA